MILLHSNIHVVSSALSELGQITLLLTRILLLLLSKHRKCFMPLHMGSPGQLQPLSGFHQVMLNADHIAVHAHLPCSGVLGMEVVP